MRKNLLAVFMAMVLAAALATAAIGAGPEACRYLET